MQFHVICSQKDAKHWQRLMLQLLMKQQRHERMQFRFCYFPKMIASVTNCHYVGQRGIDFELTLDGSVVSRFTLFAQD